MKEITKEWLKSLNPCTDGFKWWIKHGERDPIKCLEEGFEGNNWDYRRWLMVRLLSDENKVKLAIYSAELVLPIFEERYPNDDRPRKAIDATYSAAAYYDNKKRIKQILEYAIKLLKDQE